MFLRTVPAILLFGSAVVVSAQTNFTGFNYQAVVRNSGGDPVPDQSVGLQVVIQAGTMSYTETHTTTTDAYGLITVEVGQGTPAGGGIPTFGAIPWSGGQPISYAVNVDVTGGTNYVFLGGGPFKAVPFAFHALTSDSSSTPPQTLSLSHDTLYISNGNGVYLSGLAHEPGWVVSGDTLYNGGKRVGIGTAAPDTTLHIVGGIKYQDGNQGVGKFLGSDADGHASWEELNGASLLGAGNLPQGDPSCLRRAADVPYAGGGSDVVVAGNYAYVGSSAFLSVFDLSEPSAPVLSEQLFTWGGSIGAMAVSGGHLFTLGETDNVMMVFDLSDPTAPVQIGSISTAGLSSDLVLVDDRAYVLTSDNTTQIFDVSDPGAPSLIGTIHSSSPPSSIAVSGDFVYLAAGDVEVYDVSDLSAPVLSTTFSTGAYNSSLALSGDHLYVGASGTLSVYNLSDPGAPSLAASIVTGSISWNLTITGNYLYWVDSGGAVQVFNMIDPNAPSLAVTIPTDLFVSAAAAGGNYVFLVSEAWTSMQVFEVFCPGPTVVVDPATGQLTTAESAWRKDGAHITNTNPGNVGIGTSTPAANLDVVGTLKLTDGTQGAGKLLTSDADGHAAWQSPVAETDPGVSSATTNQVPKWNGTTLTDGVITDDGTGIGIGTTTPAATLDVVGTLKLTDGTQGAGKLLTSDADGNATWQSPGAETDPGVSSATTNKVPKWNGTTLTDGVMTDDGSRVGVGTTTPANKLDVEGGMAVGASYAGSNAAPADGAIIQGNVGIGTNAPGEQLTVRTASTTANARIASLANAIGDVQFSLVTARGATTNVTGSLTTQIGQCYGTGGITEGMQFFRGLSGSDGAMALKTNNSERLRITSGGAVGIGTASPTALLSVNGSANNTTGSWGVFSDARIKTVKHGFTDGLNVIGRLRPVVFTYNDRAPFHSDKEQVGVIAQELEQVAPYMVSQQANGDLPDMREVDNQAYVFLLINAVKELNALVQKQQKTIDDLRASSTYQAQGMNAIRTQLETNTQVMLRLQGMLDAQGRK